MWRHYSNEARGTRGAAREVSPARSPTPRERGRNAGHRAGEDPESHVARRSAPKERRPAQGLGALGGARLRPEADEEGRRSIVTRVDRLCVPVVVFICGSGRACGKGSGAPRRDLRQVCIKNAPRLRREGAEFLARERARAEKIKAPHAARPGAVNERQARALTKSVARRRDGAAIGGAREGTAVQAPRPHEKEDVT